MLLLKLNSVIYCLLDAFLTLKKGLLNKAVKLVFIVYVVEESEMKLCSLEIMKLKIHDGRMSKNDTSCRLFVI